MSFNNRYKVNQLFLWVRNLLYLAFFVLYFSGCIYFQSSTTDHPEYFDKVISHAVELRESGKVEKSIEYVDSVYSKYPNPGVGDLFRKYDHIRYCYFYDKKNYEEAMRYSDSSLFILQNYANEKKYMWSYASANFFKGDNFLEQKKYNDAFQSFYKGKLVAESIYDPCALSEFDSRLGLVCYKQANFLDASVYFKMAFDKINKCSKNFIYAYEQQRLLDNIALSFDKSNMPDSAIYYFNYALKFIEKNESIYPDKLDQFKAARGVIYGNIGDSYYKQFKIDTAEALLKKSIAINIQKGYDNQDARLNQLKLANLYLDSDRSSEAYNLITDVKISLDTLPQEEADFRWRYLRWKYYDKTKHLNEAYLALQSYNSLKDSLNEDNKKLVGTSIREEFENLERKHQLDFFKKSDELKRAYLAIVIVFSFFVILILISTWRNWKKTQRNLDKLDMLNKHISYQKMQLEHTLDILEQSNLEKDRIMKVVAHDLNNPLGATSNIADILLKEEGLTSDQREMITLIKTSVSNSIEMISDLVEAHLNSSETEIKKESVDINALLIECVELLRFKASEKKQTIELSNDENIILKINKEKIIRVVLNLIVNAIKFSPEGEVIKVSVKKQLNTIKVSVEDNGIGVPKENEEKIFDMFTSANRLGTAGEPSFGLGLSISKKIIEAHDGTIGFINKKSKGAIFYFILPIENN